MKAGKALKIALLTWAALYVIAVSISYFTNYTLFKWLLFGPVRMVGTPMQATVYFDEIPQPNIKVYRINKHYHGGHANQYLLYQPLPDNLHFALYVDMQLRDAGVGNSSKNDYGTLGNLLFQSEGAARFIQFKDNGKGWNFDSHLIQAPGNIMLDVPPHFNNTYPNLQHIRLHFY